MQNTQYNTIEEGGAAETSVHNPVEDTCAVHTHTHSHAQQRRNEISMIHTQPAMASSFAHSTLTGNSINILAYGREALCWASTRLPCRRLD